SDYAEYVLTGEPFGQAFFYPFYWTSRDNFYVLIGQQFGGIAEIGLLAGLNSKQLTYRANTNPGLYEELFWKPVLQSFSRFSMGFDGRNKRKIQACEFLNCYIDYRRLFKVDLSNLLYADELNQNVK